MTMTHAFPPILPPAWLGMLGGGQLGRMFVHAAQAMGYKVCVLDPDPNSPAAAAAERHLCAAYTDADALASLAASCAAVTTEFENVPAQALDALAAAGVRVAPGSACVSIAQNRVAEKKFLAGCAQETGISAAPSWVIEHDADIAQVPEALLPGILKTARMGYDGKGQVRVADRAALHAGWAELGRVPCVLEKRLALAYEVSALVARGADGATVVYPLAENVHRNGILHTTTVPSPHVSPDVADQVKQAAQTIASRMGYVGVLCVEFFVLQDGSVVANEIAPRPHNSGHYTMDACLVSQFEQQVRAMAGLPLGSTQQHEPVVMLNLLGDIWFEVEEERTPPWDAVLGLEGARLHLYGKTAARPGRKMGHLNCMATTLEQATQTCGQAMQLLKLAVN